PPEDNDRRGLLWTLLALLVAAVGAGAFWLLGGDDDGADDPAADAPSRTEDAPGTAAPDDGEATSAPPAAAPASCDPVTVWSAPELLPAVTAAAERAGDDCFSYDVQERETATSQAEIRSGEAPDVWLPSSVAWAQLAAQEGV